MAVGKQIGEFSLKTTSLTLTPGPGGRVLIQGNFEGTSPTFGTILRTATFVSVGAKSGTFSVCAAAYLENGGTVVIGGIFSRDENTLTNRVPLLGDIPLLGNVFRNNARRDNKTELLIFVTPRILKDSLNMR